MVVSIVIDHSTPGPPVSRGKALHYIEKVERQFDRIVGRASGDRLRREPEQGRAQCRARTFVRDHQGQS